MYRPTIKSNLWLGLMTLAFLGLSMWSENSRVTVRPVDYAEKLEASQIMRSALEVLQEYRLPQVENTRTGEATDPLVYTMLGEKDSPITTDEGRIDEKLTVLNPNFSAVVVDLMNKAGLEPGDTVAVMLTGSMPGANLAVFSAAKSKSLYPVVITSVGSSWWGANAPDFTWLDMERVLVAEGIFSYRSRAASAGGSDDHGGLRLSDIGRRMIVDAIQRNEVTFIEQGTLSANILGRRAILERTTELANYSAIINVGGGVASLGHRSNFDLIPSGLNLSLPEKNYPGRGVVHIMNDIGKPVINIAHITPLAREYDLPIAQLPLPKVGVGYVFEHQRYNLSSAAIAVSVMFIILIIVKYFDRQRYKWREEQLESSEL